MQFPEHMRKRVAEALTTAFSIAQNRTQFARNRDGHERGFSYHNKGFSLEGIGGTFFMGHIVYSYLNCPYDGVTIYNLLPYTGNRILIDPETFRAIPANLAPAELVARLNPITSHYTEGQAAAFIRLMQLPAYAESNFAKHDHVAVRDCLQQIGDLPYLNGVDEPVILYNALVFFVKMANRLWFYNGEVLNFTYERGDIGPADPGTGFELDYQCLDLVESALCDEHHPIEETCAHAFYSWLSSTAQLDIVKCYAEFSKLQYSGDITFVGQTIPDEFFEKFTTAILDNMSNIVKYAALFHSQGVTFFREYARVSRIMKAMYLDPKLASAIGRKVDPAFFFGWYSGAIDLTPSVVQDYLDEFYTRHGEIIELWRSFLTTHYHMPDENVAFAPIVTGLYSINGYGQKEIYSYSVVAPYDKMATKINVYPEGESIVDDMYSSLQDNSIRFSKTDRVIEALRPPHPDRFLIDIESWEFNPRLDDLMRRALWEPEVNYINDTLESVELRYHAIAYLLIPKLNIELPYVINVFEGYARLPYAWNKIPVPVASLELPQLAFAFTREEASEIDNTGEDEYLTKLYLQRLDKLAAGKVIGRRMLTILPELTKAARFTWNSYIATSFPITADKCLQKIRVTANYNTLPSRVVNHRTVSEMTFPRVIELAYPINVNELDSRDRNMAIRNYSPSFRRNGIIHYGARDALSGSRVLTRNPFTNFMENYVIAISRVRFEEEYFTGLGKFIDVNNPDNITIMFTSPFFEADPRVREGIIIGDGVEEDFYDPFGPEKNAIVSSFMALSGIVFHLATNGHNSFFGPLHPINIWAMRNFADVYRFWQTLNPEGSPSESDGLLVRGRFANILHEFAPVYAAIRDIIDAHNLNEQNRIDNIPDRVDLNSLLTVELISNFSTSFFTAIRNVTFQNENIFFSRAGYIHYPLFFGDLYRLLTEKRFGYVRGLSLQTKPITFNITSIPSMRDTNATQSLKAVANSFANIYFENFLRFMGA